MGVPPSRDQGLCQKEKRHARYNPLMDGRAVSRRIRLHHAVFAYIGAQLISYNVVH